MAAAASLTSVEHPMEIITKIPAAGALEFLRPGEIDSLLPVADALRSGSAIGRQIVENTNSIWREPKGFVVALFSALAHISSVCPHAVVHLMDDLIPILTYMLQDPTCHAKRSVSPSYFLSLLYPSSRLQPGRSECWFQIPVTWFDPI